MDPLAPVTAITMFLIYATALAQPRERQECLKGFVANSHTGERPFPGMIANLPAVSLGAPKRMLDELPSDDLGERDGCPAIGETYSSGNGDATP